jgi:hypothetical protein
MGKEGEVESAGLPSEQRDSGTWGKADEEGGIDVRQLRDLGRYLEHPLA